MSNNIIVEREKGLVELERRIAELREASAAQPLDMSSEMAALELKYRRSCTSSSARSRPGRRCTWRATRRGPRRSITSPASTVLTSCTATATSATTRRSSAGFALLKSRPVMVMGQQRGRDTKENLRRNFGMPAPEGYRKASRLARLGARLGLPIVTFVDTKGADPGISSEEHAQSEAIATCLQSFSSAAVPIVATVIGEGGSGGALALAIADHVIMLEHSTYSVASPEGCAAILWSDASKAEEAAARLKLTADDLRRFGIVDEILPEPLGGAHRDAAGVVGRTLDAVDAALTRMAALPRGKTLGGAISKVPAIGRMAIRERLEPIGSSALKRRAHPLLRFAGRITARRDRRYSSSTLVGGPVRARDRTERFRGARAVVDPLATSARCSGGARNSAESCGACAIRKVRFPRFTTACASCGRTRPSSSSRRSRRRSPRLRERYARRNRDQPQRLRRDGAFGRRRPGDRPGDRRRDAPRPVSALADAATSVSRSRCGVRDDDRTVSLAPQIRDDELEEQIASYLKSTEEWEPADGLPAAERHFLRKKRRAALFETRGPS